MKSKYRNNYFKLIMVCLCVCFCFCTTTLVLDLFKEYNNQKIFAASWESQAVAPTVVDPNGYTVIENEKNLAYLIKNVNVNGKYRVGRNLDMKGYNWPGIGNSGSGKTFKGVFDGGGFIISNLTTETTWSSTGLFGSVSGATISNVSLTDCTIKGSSQVGALVGKTAGATKIKNIVLTNCKVEAIFYSTGKWVDIGGVVGIADGTTTIESIYNNKGAGGYVKASISNTKSYDVYMGGIVGHIKANVVVKNCVNEADVINTSEISNTYSLFAGGIIGYSYAPVSLCGNTGAISAGHTKVNNAYAGGIVAYGQGNITDCYNRGSVTADAKSSDISSQSKLSDTSRSELCSLETGFLKKKYRIYGSSSVTKEGYNENAYAGGIVGYFSKSTTNCYSIGNVTGGGKYLKTIVSYTFEIEKWSKNFWGQWGKDGSEGTETQKATAFTCKPYAGPICGNTDNTSETNTLYNATIKSNINGTEMENPWTSSHNYLSYSTNQWGTNASLYRSMGLDGKMGTFMREADMVYWVGISTGVAHGGIGIKPSTTKPVSNISSHSYSEDKTFSTDITVRDERFSTTISSTKSSSISTTKLSDNWVVTQKTGSPNMSDYSDINKWYEDYLAWEAAWKTNLKNDGYPYIKGMYWGE